MKSVSIGVATPRRRRGASAEFELIPIYLESIAHSSHGPAMQEAATAAHRSSQIHLRLSDQPPRHGAV